MPARMVPRLLRSDRQAGPARSPRPAIILKDSRFADLAIAIGSGGRRWEGIDVEPFSGAHGGGSGVPGPVAALHQLGVARRRQKLRRFGGDPAIPDSRMRFSPRFAAARRVLSTNTGSSPQRSGFYEVRADRVGLQAFGRKPRGRAAARCVRAESGSLARGALAQWRWAGDGRFACVWHPRVRRRLVCSAGQKKPKSRSIGSNKRRAPSGFRRLGATLTDNKRRGRKKKALRDFGARSGRWWWAGPCSTSVPGRDSEMSRRYLIAKVSNCKFGKILGDELDETSDEEKNLKKR